MGDEKKPKPGLLDFIGWKDWKIPDDWTSVGRDRTQKSVSEGHIKIFSYQCQLCFNNLYLIFRYLVMFPMSKQVPQLCMSVAPKAILRLWGFYCKPVLQLMHK